MHNRIRRWLCLSGCLTLTGCLIAAPWPGKAETSPAVRGRIADARTKEPVPGVSVEIHGRPETASMSNSGGNFRLASGRQFYLLRFLSPGDVYDVLRVRERSCKIDFSHPDYFPLCLDAFWEWQYWDSPPTNPVPSEIVIRDALLTPKGQ